MRKFIISGLALTLTAFVLLAATPRADAFWLRGGSVGISVGAPAYYSYGYSPYGYSGYYGGYSSGYSPYYSGGYYASPYQGYGYGGYYTSPVRTYYGGYGRTWGVGYSTPGYYYSSPGYRYYRGW